MASSTPSLLLIHPPVTKPCEPPAGIARLATALKSAGVDCRIWDASVEGVLYLLDHPLSAGDVWTRRAVGRKETNLTFLRSWAGYAHADRYRKAVMEIHRLLHLAGQAHGVQVSLANYGDPRLSPVRSVDLLKAAQTYKGNPFFPFFKTKLEACWADHPPDIVGLSVNFMSQALCAFAMAGFIRECFPSTRIIMGGGLITSWMCLPDFDRPFKGLVDDLVAGPGEDALLAMCGVDKEMAAAIGSDYKPFPMDLYLSPGSILPYSTASGCYWRRCRFCPEKAEQSPYRPHPLESVAADIRDRADDMKPILIHFLDNALPPKLLAHLIAHPPGAPWYGFVRMTRHLTDPDFAAGLKKSGCVMLKLGVESGDPAVLEALEKGIESATVSAGLKTLKQAGIATFVYLLFGTPAESPESAQKTLDFTAAHAGFIDFLNLAIFNLPAYSPDARELETADFYPGDLSLYREFIHPLGWHRDRVRRFLEKDFRRHAAIRPILNNNPPFFTSNHAPFFGVTDPTP